MTKPSIRVIAAEELAVHDPGSPFLIAFVPVTIQGEPTCHEHTARARVTPADLARLPLAPGDRRYVEHLLARTTVGVEDETRQEIG